MKRIGLVTWLYLALSAFVAGLVYLVWLPTRGGELDEKERYAYLQKVAFDHDRNGAQFAGNPIILTRSDGRPHTVLGLPSSRDKTRYVWMTLDEADEAINRVTLIPDNESFVVSCGYVAEIESTLRLARYTTDFLRAHCQSTSE